jgi:hypothetical protein
VPLALLPSGLQVFVNVFFICDVALNFYTAYYDRNDVLVTDSRQIKVRSCFR